MTSDAARSLCDRIFGMVRADAAEVRLTSADEQHVRHAASDVTTTSVVVGHTVRLTVSYGRRSASAATSHIDDGALRNLVDRAQTLARLAPEDPEHMPPPDDAPFAAPVTWSEATAAVGPADVIGWVRPAVEKARDAGIEAAGFLRKTVSHDTLAATTGLFVHQRSTTVGYSVTARGTDGNGSGWASTQVNDARDLDCGAVAVRAITKAVASRDPRPREARPTTAVLEPAAVRDLVSWLVWQLDRRRFDEGRSFLNRLVKDGDDPLGSPLFGAGTTLVSDPLAPQAPCITHADGIPLGRTTWIEGGRLAALGVGRFWARKQGLAPQPWPGNIVMPGEEKTLDQLVGMVDDGILVTRIWYLRTLEPQVPSVTALTRDGTFAIRKGRLAEPVNNFRFNESPVDLLRRVVASGISERVLGSEAGFPAAFPPLVVEGFALSSTSEAT
jgi:predicted Zn-dependent protease